MVAIDKEVLIEAHRPGWKTFRLWVLFSAILLAAEGLLAWTVVAGNYWLAVPLVLLVAHFMHSQLMAFHEAAHGVFCPPRWLNEYVGVLIGVFHFNSLSLFRAVHHTHHAYLGTEQDEQLWPFVDPSVPRWQRRLAAAVELSCGMFFDAAMFWRAFFRRRTPIRSDQARRRIRAEFGILVAVWTAALAAIAWYGVWMPFLFMYVAPVMITGSLYAWRKYIEHMGLTGETAAGLSRSVVHTSPLGRLWTYTMYNIGFHAVHHAYSSMPQHSLPRFAHSVAAETEEAEAVFPNYYTALLAMLPSLADPRVGPQWNRPAPAAESQQAEVEEQLAGTR